MLHKVPLFYAYTFFAVSVLLLSAGSPLFSCPVCATSIRVSVMQIVMTGVVSGLYVSLRKHNDYCLPSLPFLGGCGCALSLGRQIGAHRKDIG